jgi:hypothetical protein
VNKMTTCFPKRWEDGGDLDLQRGYRYKKKKLTDTGFLFGFPGHGYFKSLLDGDSRILNWFFLLVLDK